MTAHIPEHRRVAWPGLSEARAKHRKLISAAEHLTPLPLDIGAGLRANDEDLTVERRLLKRPSWLDADEYDCDEHDEEKPICDVLEWTATGQHGAIQAHLYIDAWDLTDRTAYLGPGGSSHAPGFYLLYRTFWNTPLSRQDWDQKARRDAGLLKPRHKSDHRGVAPFANPGGIGINSSDTLAFMDRGEVSVLASLCRLYADAVNAARRAAPAAASQQALDTMVDVLRSGLAAGLAGDPPGVPWHGQREGGTIPAPSNEERP